MGFFLHDLHQQIKQLHQEQLVDYQGRCFSLYRGQELSTEDFMRVQNIRGGLMAFNSFLSTSKDRATPLAFAESASKKDNTIGILFILHMDPKITSTPFADTTDISYFQEEEEVLFSMHAIFRVGEIKPSTSGEQNTYEGLIGILELPAFVSDLNEEDNSEALPSLDEDTASRKEMLANTLNSLASTYDSIGKVHISKKQYTEALSYHKRAFEIRDALLPEGHFSLAISHNNIGIVYYYMGRNQEASEFLKKALPIARRTRLELHPDSATLLRNMGKILSELEQYSDAKSCLEKVLSIQHRTLPANHVDLFSTYAGLGMVNFKMRNYHEAVIYHQKALDIWRNDPFAGRKELGICYNNIGVVNYEHGSYPEALNSFANALIIQEQLFESLASSTMKIRVYIAMVYQKLWGFTPVSSE